MGARLLVLQHEDEAPAGWLGERWTARGASLEVLNTHRAELDDPATVPSLDGYDALVVLGGAMGANDEDDHGWLRAAKALIRAALAQEKPFLGVCLGHQIAAVALGGQVAPNPSGRTVGTVPLTLTEDGTADPLLGSIAGARVTHYNNDVVTALPPAATVLAQTADGHVQAARFGARAWGVQFHPEVTPEDFTTWVDSFTDPSETLDADAILADVLGHTEALRHTGFTFADTFADLLAPSRHSAR